MTCQNCGFCKEDLETLESRGVYNVTRALERAVNKCDCIGTMRKDDRKYMENIENDVNSDGWNVEDKISLLKDAQGLIQLYQRDFTPQPTQHEMGFTAMLDAARVERSMEEEQPNIKREASVRRGMGGFGEMLEESRMGTERSSEKNEDNTKSIIRGYSMGFRAMLDGASYGTSEERSFQTEADDESNLSLRRDGFVGQLEDSRRGTLEKRMVRR
jgi:hypothetical protein